MEPPIFATIHLLVSCENLNDLWILAEMFTGARCRSAHVLFRRTPIRSTFCLNRGGLWC